MMESYNQNQWSAIFFISYLTINLYFIMNLVIMLLENIFLTFCLRLTFSINFYTLFLNFSFWPSSTKHFQESKKKNLGDYFYTKERLRNMHLGNLSKSYFENSELI